MREVLSFYLTNNTNGLVPVSLFGNNSDPMDNSNATLQYSWNVSSLTITNEDSVYLQFKSPNDASFSVANISFGGGNLINVVNALNTLNLGSFFITTSGASTFINIYNQNIVFGNLTIYSSSTTTFNYQTILGGTGGSGNIIKNAIIQVNFPSTPLSTSGTISITNGDAMSINGISTNSASNKIDLNRTNNQTGVTTTLFSITPPPLTLFSQSFSVFNGFSYTLTWSD